MPVEWGKGKPRRERLAAARLEALALNASAKRRGVRERVFVNSMSDILDDEVPIEWFAFVLDTIRQCDRLDFQLLTKRPRNWRTRMVAAAAHTTMSCNDELRCWLLDWVNHGIAPENVWWGTTVEDQERADERIPQIIEIPAKVRFLSCEPLLGPIDFDGSGMNPLHGGERIHWVICGGESGPKARPMHPTWANRVKTQCQGARVPFFFKQWGEHVDFDNMPDDTFKHSGPFSPLYFADGVAVCNVGKKAAGRLLDGVEHSAFPEVAK
jgi:protein gp37